MTENFMIHRSSIFASYHNNFWLMKILIISIRGPSLRLEVNSKPCRACFPRLLIFLILLFKSAHIGLFFPTPYRQTANPDSISITNAVIAYRGYRVKKRDNEIISQQKAVVEEEKHILEENNKEILDSINYAKELQEAILPPLEQINENFKENFVYYKPKDIAAGDFYWLHVLNNEILIAAADCTGHGVPGAIVSVVCSNALNRSVVEFGKTIPGEILDKSRELVLETFSRSGADVKDGMDISLLSVKKSNGDSVTVQWSGANNPLWYISSGELHSTRFKLNDKVAVKFNVKI